MSTFHFYKPIEIRYGDLDPQGHVNNSVYLTYFEQARVAYITQLGLWKVGDYQDIGVILADAHVTYHAPLLLGQKIRVGVRVARMGNKSLNMEYTIEDCESCQECTSGSTVLVAYDYHTERSMPIPELWRQRINDFENPVTST